MMAPTSPARTSASRSGAVLVSSFDGAADLWKPFFTLLFKYWPDCPFEVYLIAQNETYPDSRVTMLPTDPGLDWSSTLHQALDRLSHDYLLVFLEDYFLTGPVNTERVVDYERVARRTDAATVRMVPIPPPDGPVDELSDLGTIPVGGPYRTSLMAGWWNKATLKQLLVPGETPWEFELEGTKRSDRLSQTFFSVASKPPIPYFVSGVVQGKWLPAALELCEKEGISVDSSHRPIETKWGRSKRLLRIRVMDTVASLLGRTRKAKSK